MRSVNCSYFIPNVTGQQAYRFFDKIHMRLEAGGAPVAVKLKSVNWSTKVRSSLYNASAKIYPEPLCHVKFNTNPLYFLGPLP
jgi:hypothetical protein